MNQILFTIENLPNKNKKKNLIFLYKYLFILSILLIIICIIVYFFIRYNSYKKDKISKNLMNSFSISTLYSNLEDTSAKKINTDNFFYNPFVIGIIEIEKIDIMYPILSTTTDDFLKIAPCRFAGPMPNKIGNLCIAGHNYANNKIFGKLHLLDIGDIVKIYDLSGEAMQYKINNKYEVLSSDLSCTNQNTNGQIEVTLITCNTLKGNRLVFKCSPTVTPKRAN